MNAWISEWMIKLMKKRGKKEKRNEIKKLRFTCIVSPSRASWSLQNKRKTNQSAKPNKTEVHLFDFHNGVIETRRHVHRKSILTGIWCGCSYFLYRGHKVRGRRLLALHRRLLRFPWNAWRRLGPEGVDCLVVLATRHSSPGRLLPQKFFNSQQRLFTGNSECKST